MNKRAIKIIYLGVLAIELMLCYKWLIKPVGPVILALMKGTYNFNLVTNFTSAITAIMKVAIQTITFAFVIIGTTKLYKHFYVSLPSDSDTDNN